MKQSPAGKLAMDREQLRGCSHSLLMQEVCRRKLSISQPNAGKEPGKGRKHPSTSHLSNSWQDDTSTPRTTSPHADACILMWMMLPPAPLLIWMILPCILLSSYPIGPVDSPRCVARGSYYFGGPEVHYAASSSLLIFWDPKLTSDHLTQARAALKPVRPSGRSP